ncbi:excisionase [Enterobacter cancerogenus]|uniref:excisionase n=1 Tax=Enterobacter cancerogenus TaxID=69218 RepID=UPI00405939B1
MIGLECIPLKAYCSATGESIDKVKDRVASGVWRLGTHVIKIPGQREWWVDLVEVNLWVRSFAIPLSDKELGINWAALEDNSKTSKRRR